ncbi:MAG: glycine dehydrogenase, partial [Planctomycetota bacterium]
ELVKVTGVKLKFDRPFFKEFVIEVPTDPVPLLEKLLKAGYHAGLPLGRWYPQMSRAISIAVTEKRTKAEMDGLVTALAANL